MAGPASYPAVIGLAVGEQIFNAVSLLVLAASVMWYLGFVSPVNGPTFGRTAVLCGVAHMPLAVWAVMALLITDSALQPLTIGGLPRDAATAVIANLAQQLMGFKVIAHLTMLLCLGFALSRDQQMRISHGVSVAFAGGVSVFALGRVIILVT